MAIEIAEKRDLTDVKSQAYDEELHDRFVRWVETSGKSQRRVAAMINRSEAYVSQYINKIFSGNLKEFEYDIASLLRREEDLELVLRPQTFCATGASILIWEVLEYCDKRQRMGVVIAESGSGKTVTANEYQRQNPMTTIVTANTTTRTLGATMRLLMERVGGRHKVNTIDEMLNVMIQKLKHAQRLLIIDDAHFIPWPGLEVIRKLYDCAGVGVVYLGQEALYNQMTGKTDKARLFDQIYSRIAIKRDRIGIEREDVKMIVESLCPGKFDKDEMVYLTSKAKEKGHLRNVTHLLEMFMDVKQGNPEMTNMEALKVAEEFLLQK